jgi:anti-sigma factor RsiW
MENRMPCSDALRVHAYFDGEVDALSAAEIESHMAGCAECKALLEDLRQLRGALRQDLAYERAPASLRARVSAALDAESVGADAGRAVGDVSRARRTSASAWRGRSFWAGALSGVGGAAIAAGIALLIFLPRFDNPLVDDVVSAHLRSLMPAHLIDVVSTDKHTVKPWFATHADVSPVVADFESQGYKLVGGRADYFDGQRAAVVVYQHGSHVINMFSWRDERYGLPGNMTRNGYHLVFWRAGNLIYCTVSDAGWDEVLGLTRLLQNLSADDSRG